MAKNDSLLAELQQLLAAQQLSGLPTGQHQLLGNGWQQLGIGQKIDPRTGQADGRGTSARDQLAQYGIDIGNMSDEEAAARYAVLGKFTDPNDRESTGYAIDLQNGGIVGNAFDTYERPFDVMKDLVAPAAIVFGGGALAGSLLGGAGFGVGMGGAAGGEIAGLAANQVGALGGAGGAGGAGTLGASYIPTAVSAMEALPAISTIGASSIPELATLAGSLGADFGAASLASAAGAGGNIIPSLGQLTAVESMAALEPLTGIGSLGIDAMPLLGAEYGATELASLAGSGLNSAGSSSAVKNAMYGSEGYGPGMTGAQTGAYDSVLGATGSKTLADLAANSTIGSSLINGASGLANLVGGGQNLAGLVGAVAGGASGGGTNTKTSEEKLDPRMAQYLYGTGYGDANSLLGAAQKLYQQNPTGINPTMQQGMDMQKAALTDPAYAQSFQAMRNAGTGLLGQGVAANPFTSGQASGLLNMGQPNAQAGGAGGLMNIDPNAANRLIQMGRGLLPGSI